MTANPIDVIEAAYSLEGTESEWLGRLGNALAPLIDGGLGWMAYFYDLEQSSESWLNNAVGIDPDMWRAAVPDDAIARMAHRSSAILSGAVAALIDAGLEPSTAMPNVHAYWSTRGARDAVAFRTVEAGSRGVSFVALQPEVCRFEPRVILQWTQVSAHIAAARRLRETLSRTDDAVLTPDGRVEHAEGEAKTARDELRDAVERQEKARGRARREDPDGATEAWTALVSGRWSLVDRFERDGRRYIVARRNEHALADPRALTARERVVATLAALGRSNKLIGYELGIAESTIATHLASAMRKLRVSSRVELATLISQLVPPS